MNKKLIALAVMGLAGWWLYRQSQQSENYFVDITDTVSGALGSAVGYIDDAVSGVFLKVSNMKYVTALDVANVNVQAFLKVIRKAEGTDGVNGYRTIFGGQLFTSYADHPRVLVKTAKYQSTAAGAYQFKASTWDETRDAMKLTDFSPANQDKAAVGRIAARNALEDVKAGRFAVAIKKCAGEWASLPGATYGQPTITIQTAQSVYTANGGGLA
jgi:muramidase (phage lysozyme)